MDVLMEKNLQHNRAGSRKTGKLLIPDLRSVEKTSDRMINMQSGLSKDHKKPKKEFRYLSLNSFTVRFLTSSL